VNANSGGTVTFIITPRQVGYLPIKITAICDSAGDGIEQLLLVEPEGSPIYVNKAVLIDLRTEREKNVDIIIETPSNAVPDSTKSQISVFGDMLGNTIEYLDKLILIPTGCPEQIISRFVPMIMVLRYLQTIQQLTPAIQTRILGFMETGYQLELNQMQNDGSFVFNTWLTAFVVRYFAEASVYISIDNNVLNRALDWLVSKQSENGQFVQVGNLYRTGELLISQFKNHII
jgi:CD109 antigen